jgi:hypothetical protein
LLTSRITEVSHILVSLRHILGKRRNVLCMIETRVFHARQIGMEDAWI